MHRIPALLAATALMGCQAPRHDDGFAIIDAAAREAGVALEVDGVDRTSSLPVSVRGEEMLTAWLPAGPVQLAPLPGEVLRIGADDVSSGFLGEDVATDALALSATPEAAEELALLADGQLRGDVLSGEALFVALADLDAPDGLREVRTLALDDARRPVLDGPVHELGTLHTQGRGSASRVTVHHVITAVIPSRDAGREPVAAGAVTKTLGAGGSELHRDPRHVGVYVGHGTCLILDAAGDAGPCGAEERTQRWSSEADAIVLHSLLATERLPFTTAGADALEHAAGPLVRVELQ